MKNLLLEEPHYNNETTGEPDVLSDAEWIQWQAGYAIKRRKSFDSIVEAQQDQHIKEQ